MSPANENDTKDKQTTTPETPPPLVAQPIIPEEDFEESSGRRWLMLFVYFVLALAVAFLVVLAGRWVYNKVTDHKSEVTPQPAGNNTPQPPAQQPQQPPASPQPNTQTPPPSQNTQQLPNSGPGDVAAIFLGTAFIMGGLHYLINLRRA